MSYANQTSFKYKQVEYKGGLMKASTRIMNKYQTQVRPIEANSESYSNEFLVSDNTSALQKRR